MNLNINKLTRSLLVSPGSKHIETKIIQLEKIYVPRNINNKTINIARAKDLNQEHINKVATSLKNGIDYSKMPPAVTKSNRWVDGTHYEYDLVTGAHRFAAMEQLNITEWIFEVYKIGTDKIAKDLAMSSLQIRENDHSPTMANSIDDLINILSRLINKKLLANNQIAIENYLSQNTKNVHHKTFEKIVQSVVRQNGAYQDIRIFPKEILYKFLENNSDYAFGGEYDIERKEYGWTVQEGKEHSYMINVLRRLGKGTDYTSSYFLLHTQAPSNAKDLTTKRQGMIRYLNVVEEGIEKAYKFREVNGRWPWRVEAFLGQDVKNKEKDFLSVDEAIGVLKKFKK